MKVCKKTTWGEWTSRLIVPIVIDVAPLKPMTRTSLCGRSSPIKSFFWKPIMGVSTMTGTPVVT
ncbi:unnamed protein product [Prunus armeniaca]